MRKSEQPAGAAGSAPPLPRTAQRPPSAGIDTRAQRERLGWRPLTDEERAAQLESNLEKLDPESFREEIAAEVTSVSSRCCGERAKS